GYGAGCVRATAAQSGVGSASLWDSSYSPRGWGAYRFKVLKSLEGGIWGGWRRAIGGISTYCAPRGVRCSPDRHLANLAGSPHPRPRFDRASAVCPLRLDRRRLLREPLLSFPGGGDRRGARPAIAKWGRTACL